MAPAHQALCDAITRKRLVTFLLDGRRRVAEPHDLGVIDGEVRLFVYQVGGESRSRPPVGWRWGALSRISELRVLDQTFPGTRPTATGRHVRWDVLLATVSPRTPEETSAGHGSER